MGASFDTLVKSLADKDDKTDAGKLIAASAHTKEAFTAVKTAMDDSFNAVVKSLVKEKSPKALSIIKAMARNKSNFDNIVQIIGNDYLKSLDVKQVKSLFTSVDKRNYGVFATAAKAVGDTNYKAAFENDTKLRNKHEANINKSSLPEDLVSATGNPVGSDEGKSIDSQKATTVAKGGGDNIIENIEIVRHANKTDNELMEGSVGSFSHASSITQKRQYDDVTHEHAKKQRTGDDSSLPEDLGDGIIENIEIVNHENNELMEGSVESFSHASSIKQQRNENNKSLGGRKTNSPCR
jgi:hypothetical protein